MNSKTKNIVGWVLAGLLGFVFIGSGVNKIVGGEEAAKMAAGFGLDAASFKIIAVVEIISFILFLLPRTGIVGTLLLAAYMGGAIATHLEHGESFVAQCVIEAVIWITAALRFPELTERLFGK